MPHKSRDALSYTQRTYRNRIFTSDLVQFEVELKETDLFIRARKNLSSEALISVRQHRTFIEEYIKFHPDFLTSLIPLKADPLAPPVVRDMLESSRRAGVGPMASVAGAIAEAVGLDLADYSADLIIENGGDVYIRSAKDRDIMIGIFAGDSPFSNKLTLKISGADTPIGVCTSSGKIGHSLSLGKSDAVCVISQWTALADAAATAIANRVKSGSDIKQALARGSEIEGVRGILIVCGDKMGAVGSLEFA